MSAAPPVLNFHSGLSGAVWPAVPDQQAAGLLALQYQFERTQWLQRGQIEALQFNQLDLLVRHARETVPYYRSTLARQPRGAALTAETFAGFPLLTRHDLQTHFDDLCSGAVPADHGEIAEARTSGSTGTPVRVLKPKLLGAFWSAFTLRDHIWHRRDLSGTLAAIRHGAKVAQGAGWGPATAMVIGGRSVTLPVSTDVRAQLDWLEQQRPDYLLSHPSNLGELARLAIKRDIRLPGLREVRASGDLLAQEVRDLCRDAWNVGVTDMYSANEVGYIALQCPDHEHYHVQSEGVLVEIIDEAGQPCAPGQTGRIVVTSLHNFATPLIRYEIGDYAEVGAPCACGRGLPVIKRILGRVRNMLVTADGKMFWPSFGMRGLTDTIPLLQHQFVQKGFDLIEVRLVTAVPLTQAQEERLRRQFLSKLPAGFRLQFVYPDVIPRGPGGKFEDFVSEVGTPPVS